MASEPYRKIGRGGAGNYYTPQDIDEAAKRINEVRIFERACLRKLKIL